MFDENNLSLESRRAIQILHKTKNIHIASLHFLTSHDAHEIHISVTATFHFFSAEVNSFNLSSSENISIS